MSDSMTLSVYNILFTYLNYSLTDPMGSSLYVVVIAGGLYFIEDMHVVRNAPGTPFGDDTNGEFIMADVIRDWIDQLIVPLRSHHGRPDPLPGHLKHRIPPGVKWITCQAEACVIAKMELHDAARGSQ
jgi:hypothetical protein